MKDNSSKTNTKIDTQIATKISLAIVFLGAGMLAAAAAGLNYNKKVSLPASYPTAVKKTSVAVLTPSQISFNHFVNYSKSSGQKSFNENDFWRQVAASNWFLSDSLVQLQKNPTKKSEYVSAMMSAVQQSNYVALKKWYDFVYSASGFNFDDLKLQKNVWLIMREAAYKKQHFADKSVVALADARAIGGGVKFFQIKFSKNYLEKKPVRPEMFAMLLGLSQKTVNGHSAGGASGDGSTGFGMTGGVSSSGGSSSVDCTESGSNGGGGKVGGNTNPTGMTGIGPTGDPVNPSVGVSGGGSSVDMTAGSKNQTGCLPYGVMPSSVGGGSIGLEDDDLNDFIKNGPPGGAAAPKDGFGVAKDTLWGDVKEFRDSTVGGFVEMTAKGTVTKGGVYVGFKGKFGGSNEEFNPEGNMDESGMVGGNCGQGGILGMGSGGDCGSGGGCGFATLGYSLISGGANGYNPADGGGGGSAYSPGSSCDVANSIMKSLNFDSDENPIEYNASMAMVGGVEKIIGLTKITK
ncbi:MAG TPA: hypothetical protein PLV72_03265 [Candidatus Magasanikbacteria bacterium]|nr:hypothetical protein [Candidatus Magasanikbacteria bacterium]